MVRRGEVVGSWRERKMEAVRSGVVAAGGASRVGQRRTRIWGFLFIFQRKQRTGNVTLGGGNYVIFSNTKG